MKIKCTGMRARMELSVIVLAALSIACSYAAPSETATPTKTHRTAKLVRDIPRDLAARYQTIEFPSYNIPNPNGPGTYAFGYEIEDPITGNVQFRDEEKLQNGTVRGSYGFLQSDGSVVTTRFIADLYGYRANTEIKQADGQVLASIPTQGPPMESQASNQDPVVSSPANQFPAYSMPPTYTPALNPNYIDPSYTQAILSHIQNQQYYPSQGLIQYPYGRPQMPLVAAQMPPGPVFYDAPSNGNFFSNFFAQFPSNLAPSNIYNNLQTTFPNIIPQQNPLNTFTSNLQSNYQQLMQNNPFSGIIGNGQASLQQLIPANNPFAGWFNPNNANGQQAQMYLQSPQIVNRPVYSDSGVYSDMPMMTMGNRVPTTKRRGMTTTRRKNGYKTRDGSDWLDDFLESRKREVVYGMGGATPATPVQQQPKPVVVGGSGSEKDRQGA